VADWLAGCLASASSSSSSSFSSISTFEVRLCVQTDRTEYGTNMEWQRTKTWVPERKKTSIRFQPNNNDKQPISTFELRANYIKPIVSMHQCMVAILKS
jgi:hypothetical protein